MQTFLPTYDYQEVARILDNKRLNKQALEAWQILMVLTELDPQGNHRTPKGWVNHPAVRMWEGGEWELFKYILAMTIEWEHRGFKTTIDDKASATISVALNQGLISVKSEPVWMSDAIVLEKLSSTHRQALLVKDYNWYSQFNWDEDPGHPPTEYTYLWPEPKGETETNE